MAVKIVIVAPTLSLNESDAMPAAKSSQPYKPIITAKEARKLMGSGASKFTDAQIEKMINDLDMIAMLQLKVVPNENE